MNNNQPNFIGFTQLSLSLSKDMYLHSSVIYLPCDAVRFCVEGVCGFCMFTEVKGVGLCCVNSLQGSPGPHRGELPTHHTHADPGASHLPAGRGGLVQRGRAPHRADTALYSQQASEGRHPTGQAPSLHPQSTPPPGCMHRFCF